MANKKFKMETFSKMAVILVVCTLMHTCMLAKKHLWHVWHVQRCSYQLPHGNICLDDRDRFQIYSRHLFPWLQQLYLAQSFEQSCQPESGRGLSYYHYVAGNCTNLMELYSCLSLGIELPGLV